MLLLTISIDDLLLLEVIVLLIVILLGLIVLVILEPLLTTKLPVIVSPLLLTFVFMFVVLVFILLRWSTKEASAADLFVLIVLVTPDKSLILKVSYIKLPPDWYNFVFGLLVSKINPFPGLFIIKSWLW